MAGRRTNLALLVALFLALVTGGLAFGVGTGWSRWATVAHGAVGFVILLLSPWKSAIARRGLARRRPDKVASLSLSVGVVAALVFGILHSSGIAQAIGPLTAMQLHVGFALLSLPVAVWHVMKRPVRLHRTDLGRRQTLRAGAVAAGGLAVVGAGELAFQAGGLRGADRRATGSYEQGSFAPDQMPVTQWLNDPVLALDPGEWRLTVGARVLNLDELLSYDDRLEATIDCTGGWYARQEWQGVWLSRLLAPTAGARSIEVMSLTGYGRLFPLRDLDHLLIATGVGGRPLSEGHGFPARLVAPSRRGFWWVKWLDRISLTERPWWLASPFPLT